MIDLEEKLANLSPEKRRLLELKLKQKKAAAGNAFPLSYAQRRLWFLQQLEPTSTAYNIPAAIRLRGSLDPAALVRALAEIVHRHEVLRTVFATVGGEPVQIVRREMDLPFRGVDLSGLEKARREAELRHVLEKTNRTVFDLTRGPLFLVTLIKLDSDEHVLHILMHHIVSDGWSVGVFIREFSALYEAFLHGRPNPLPPLPIQYADFAVWQKKRLESEVREKELQFWRQKLGNDLPVLELPTDRPRPAVKSYRGDHRRATLSAELLRKLRELSRSRGTTMFMSLLAGFYALLYRYTRQRDLCVGTPIANRTRAETEALIGFFVNTLVLRLQLEGHWSFAELLDHVREVALEVFSHQELPFEMLVEELQPERSMSHTPLFQVMFVYQNGSERQLRLPRLEVTPVPLSNKQAKFDLTLTVTELEDGLALDIEYDTDLFDPSTVDRMLEHYGLLLEAATNEPSRAVDRLDFLPKREAQKVLTWGRGEDQFPIRQPVHRLFEKQVRRTPNRIALSYEGKSLSYAELNAKANQIAHFLLEQGVQPDDRVAIYSERQLHLVPAILGVLKAGAAYLPIDPVYPRERVDFMLQDAGAQVVLTQEKLASELDGKSLKVVRLDSDEHLFAKYPEVDPVVEVAPDNLIYVIYTSGSTGKPKGTLITHRNVERLFSATDAWYGFNQEDVWTLFHSYAFDFSVWEIWGALLYGGRLVVVPYWESRNPEAFYRLLEREQVTVLNQTPSAFRQLIRAEEEVGVSDRLALRLVIFGGEALDLKSLLPWFERHGDQRPQLVNMYGITETTVHVTYRPVNRHLAETASGSVIGGPIPDLQVYIVDSFLQPTPIGVAGELVVGGEGVARGYLGRPDLTAQRFVPDPFSGKEGARLYRSGDLARFLPDGDIEYLGRIDHQVKIRGFRIELGEIEAVLTAHPGVREALVLARDDLPGGRGLVAYLVPAQPPGPSASELRDWIRTRLPEYMLPAAFVVLDAFPLTPNGKIDRRALPPPRLEAPAPSEEAMPRSPAEELLAEIFAEVLGLDRVAPTADFFELGGHSLLATQVASRVKRAFGIDLPLREIFERTTVRELSEEIDRLLRRDRQAPLEPIPRAPRDGDLPLSFSQQRLWVLDQLDPGSPLYNIPSAVRLRGNLDVEALRKSINRVVERHEVLRTNFVLKGDEPIQVVRDRLELEVPFIDLAGLPPADREHEVEKLVRQEAIRGFDLAREPLLRVKVLRLSESEHVAVITMHHTISDGWSSGVMVREVATIYDALVRGTEPQLPDLPIQYADYAYWQRRWLQGENLQREVSYWREKLAGAPEMLELPTDRPRPAVQTSSGAHIRDQLPADLTTALKKLAREENATLFMLLLAAFDVLLYRYSGQRDILVGTPIANRTRPEIEPLIGFFVNTLVIRSQLDDRQRFVDLLRQVRETTLEAYLHQELPFEKLVEELNPERSTSYSPLFQVMFVLQTGAVRKPVKFPALELEAIEVENGLSPFDLTLVAEETGQGLAVVAEYNTDLFDESTIQRLLEHFKNILGAVAKRPGLQLAQIPLASEEEKELVLHTWNKTKHALDPPLTLHERVAQTAVRLPKAVAVVDASSGASLTYEELDRRANQLAKYLKDHGVGPEVRVGLCLERSPDLLVGLLGILKSGAAYVPLDPEYPAERLTYMIRDAALPVVVTTEALRTRLPVGGYRAVCLDRDAAAFEDVPGDWGKGLASPRNLAYVIYTSGSTGVPKGVMVEHRSAVNHSLFTLDAFGLTQSDRVLQFSTINFDTAVEEIFPTLMSGATLVLRPRGVVLAVDELLSLVDKHGITVLDLPTAYWQELVHQMEAANLPWPESVRLVVTGGEKALADPYRVWRRRAGRSVRWLNTYGPTETTVVATWFEPDSAWKPVTDGVPIGKPITNARAYVLDTQLRPVPLGVPGELCIGGTGVARGYLGKPDQTAVAFAPDPFADEAGSRLYRTGDRVRFLPDGNLQFLGRVDDQVKIRGYRVELGEVEAKLLEHPDVREAAVVAEQVQGRTKRLVAYVVPANGRRLQPGPLREFLRTRLPDFMIPAAFVELDALPRTPSGKIDRRGLPRAGSEQTGVEPVLATFENDLERKLAQLWRDVLGVQHVAATDNFFELGGDSILAIQLVAKAKEAGLRLSPLQVFQHQTLRELASVVEKDDFAAAPNMPVVGQAPLTPIQRWFFEQGFRNSNHWNQSVLFEVRHRLDADLLKRAIAALEWQHDALRLRFRRSGEEWIQVFGPPGEEPSFAVVDLTSVGKTSEKAAVAGIARTAQQSLNFEEGPIYRVLYLDFGPRRPGRILFVVHHLAVDGVSWRILLEDLRVAYRQLESGQEPGLPPRTTSYRDWAEKLVTWANDARLLEEVTFWTGLVGEELRPLPLDFDGGVNDERSATSVTVSLTNAETQALLKDVPAAHKASVDEILLAALGGAFARWSGHLRILVDLEGHGRESLFGEHLDVSRTVGWFTTVYPVLLDRRGVTSPLEALKKTKETLRSIPNKGFGFGLLRYLSRDEEVRSQLKEVPAAQVSFNYLGQFDQVVRDETVFAPASESPGPDRDPLNCRKTILDVTASVAGGVLRVGFTYSENLHRRQSIEALAASFLEELRRLIHAAHEEKSATPSAADFPLANLDARKLDKVLQKLGRS